MSTKECSEIPISRVQCSSSRSCPSPLLLLSLTVHFYRLTHLAWKGDNRYSAVQSKIQQEHCRYCKNEMGHWGVWFISQIDIISFIGTALYDVPRREDEGERDITGKYPLDISPFKKKKREKTEPGQLEDQEIKNKKTSLSAFWVDGENTRGLTNEIGELPGQRLRALLLLLEDLLAFLCHSQINRLLWLSYAGVRISSAYFLPLGENAGNLSAASVATSLFWIHFRQTKKRDGKLSKGAPESM